MRRTVRAALAGAALVFAGAGPEDPGASFAPGTETEFRAFLEEVHDITLSPGPDRAVLVRPAWNVAIRPRDTFCSLEQPFVRQVVEFGIARECAKRDDPPLDEEALVRAATARVQGWLASLPEGREFPSDVDAALELRTRGEQRLHELLQENDVRGRLLVAWRTHVRESSPCRRELLQFVDGERERFFRSGGSCDVPWDQIIEVCTSWSDDLHAHVAFHPPVSTSAEKKTALKAMLEAGLSRCLAALIQRSGDADLVRAVQTLTAATALAETNETRRKAWELWRAAGVEDWLDAATREGAVPQDVALALDRCTAGEAPAD